MERGVPVGGGVRDKVIKGWRSQLRDDFARRDKDKRKADRPGIGK